MGKWTWIGGTGILLTGGIIAALAWRRHARRKAMEETVGEYLDALHGAETEEEFNAAAVDAAGAMARQEIDEATLQRMAKAGMATMIGGLFASIVGQVRTAQLKKQFTEKYSATQIVTDAALSNTSTEARSHTTKSAEIVHVTI